jgi:PKD repeat protein
MKFILTLSIFLTSIQFSSAQKFSRVKVFANEQELTDLSSLGVPTDHGIRKKGTFLISDFSEQEIQILNTYGYTYEIEIEDVQEFYIDRLSKPNDQELKNEDCSGSNSGSGSFSPQTPSNFNLGSMGGYLTYDEMLDELDAMFAQYPNLITQKDPISTFETYENRPIYHVKISDNPGVNESGEPNVLYTAIHHAREPMSLVQTIFYMWYILENYGTNDEVTYLVDHTQMYFVPCLNPDGYIYNEQTNPNGGGMWRKNRRNGHGVDLNRNYSYGWGTTGVSFNTNNDTYPGTGAFSEPETQAIKWLVETYDFEMAFNAHTYGPSILFPIGTTNEEFAEHHDYFQEYTNHMTELNGYAAFKSSGLYPASGDSDDYMYKVDIGAGEKDTIFAHTPEIGTSFWPSSADIDPTCKDFVFPNLVLAHMSRNYVVVKDTDPSSVAVLNGNFNHTAKRYGRESGPVTVSIEPISNITSVGSPIVYNLNVLETQNGEISYELNPAIQFGDEIIFILKTDNGLWIKKDTIIKTYGAITLQVYDDASNANDWTGNWSTTNATYVSPNRSFTDSPSGNYSNNQTKNFTYDNQIDLTNAVSAMISFYAKWDIEADYDYVQFQVSTDGGNSWIGQCGNYTVSGTSANGSVQPDGEPVYEGAFSDWVLEEISMSDYIGQIINVRFRLQSDGGVREDGFYFDDFKIFYSEPPQGTPPVASFTPSSFELCDGDEILLTDFSTEQPTEWSWDFGDGNSSSAQNPSHIYDVPGTYIISLEVSNSFGSNSTVQTVIVNELPEVTVTTSDNDNVVCLNDANVQLIGSPSGTSFSGSGISGTSFNPSAAGVGVHLIDASYTNSNGCTGYSSVSITVDACAQVGDMSSFDIKVFPNPNNGRFVIEGLPKGSSYTILDLHGRVIIKSVAQLNVEEIKMLNASEGLYYLESSHNGHTSRLRFVITK